jgi:hypothetical protein
MKRPYTVARGGDLGSPPTTGSAVTKPVNTYNVGPLTMQRIFEPAGLTNVSDLQAVLDAAEAALAHSA